jgi:imidazole glycerol-phosphate synthase subunit HisH
MIEVALFDYGAGNLHSLKKGLEAGGARVTVTTHWDEALARDALVLPGVGSFGAAVQALAGHEDRVRTALEDGLPCLGICLGMQLFFRESEEGSGQGIGLIPGRVRRIRARTIPQMGWNDVEARVDHGAEAGVGDDLGAAAPPDPLLRGIGPFTAYYANSFVCDPEEEQVIIARSLYEDEMFVAAVRQGRSWGVQFHPEKSSAPGLHLLRNFLTEVEVAP